MNRKKGMTLIELLAVIVVLSVIMLITVPVVINQIETSRKASFKYSVIEGSKALDLYLNENIKTMVPFKDEDSTNGISIDLLKNENITSKLISGEFVLIDDKYYSYFITDGIYCAYGPIDDLEISKNCKNLDKTPPIILDESLKLFSSTNSISAKIDFSYIYDKQSDINKLTLQLKKYNDDSIIDSKKVNNSEDTYLFKNLKENTKYVVELVASNTNGLESSYAKEISTMKINPPKYVLSPEGWSDSKTLTINYDDSNITNPKRYFKILSDSDELNVSTSSDIQVCDDNFNCQINTEKIKEEKWYLTTNKDINLLFTSKGVVIARMDDGYNYVDASSYTITKIDTTAPTSASHITTLTNNSIKVVASATDNESGIYGYQFSKDGGSTWTTIQTSNTYTFTESITGNYLIKIRAYNGTYPNGGRLYKDSESIATPTCEISPNRWSDSKTVTCENTNEYSLDGGSTWEHYSSAVKFTSNGSLIAKSTDTINYATSPVYNVTGVDTEAPTVSVSGIATSWATSDKITLTLKDTQSGVSYYAVTKSTIEPTSWTSITNSTSTTASWTAKANGKYYAWAKDSVGRISEYKEFEIKYVDRTPPTLASYTATSSNDSVKVVASATDNESGIYGYQFSKDGGSTWTAIQTSNTYTFTGISSNDYTIIIRAYNGTYPNGGRLYKDSASIATPTCEISPNGWATSKTVTCENTSQYSLDGGSTWNTYSSPVTFTSNGSLIAKAVNSTSYVTSPVYNITGIDKTSPTSAIYTATSSNDSIKVVASATDNESGIYGYQFSKDGGSTWTAIQTSNTYTFKELTETPTIKIRAYNGTYPNGGRLYRDSASIATPTCEISPNGWATSKTVTCTYPSGYTNEYSIDGGSSWKTYSSAIKFTSNGTLIARVTDGSNYLTSSSYTVSGIDRTAPSTPEITAVLNETGTAYSGQWTNKAVKITASSSDSDSKIDKIQFSYDNSSWSENWLQSYTESENDKSIYGIWDGNYNKTVYVRAIDKAGNTSGSSSISLKMDKNAPSTPSITNTSGGNWTNKSVTITASATDIASGIAKIQYSYDNSKWAEDWGNSYSSITNGKSISGTWGNARNSTVYVRACDNAGNCSSNATTSVRIDTTAPTCGTYSGDSTTWTNGDRTISVGCSDSGGSGCTNTSFSKTFSSTTKTAGAGITIKDNAGNTQSCNATQNIYIDKATPSISSYVGASKTWSNSNRAWTITPASSTSGVTNLYYYASNSTTKPDTSTTGTACSSTTSCSVPEGQYVYFRVKNAAGTYSGWSNYKNNYVDKTKPATPSITNTSGGNWTNKSVTITASSTDTASGIAKIQYSYDNSTWTEDWGNSYSSITNGKSISGTWGNARNSTLYVRACDNAGNCSSNATTSIKIDTTTPSITQNVNSPSSTSFYSVYTISFGNSGSKSVSCVYGTSTSYGNTGTVSGSYECRMSNLAQGTTYYYKISATNNAGSTGSYTGSFKTTITGLTYNTNNTGSVKTYCGTAWCTGLSSKPLTSTASCSGTMHLQVYYEGAVKYQVQDNSTAACKANPTVSNCCTGTGTDIGTTSSTSCTTAGGWSGKTIGQTTYNYTSGSYKCVRACLDSSCSKATAWVLAYIAN